jgi:Fe2+ or Zn2+ uptake regulation protein
MENKLNIKLTYNQLKVVRMLIEQKIEMPQYEDLNKDMNEILDSLNNAEIK